MNQKDLSEREKYIIFDNHMHLNPEGRFLEAVEMFLNAGGTSFNLVNLPDNKLGIEHYYETLYERTVSMARIVREEKEFNPPVSLGPYPLDYFRLKEAGKDPVTEMRKAIDLACKYIAEGEANAIGEIGRPHFPVPEEVNEHSNGIILYAMERASELNCPVILHTDDLDEAGYRLLENLADKAGLDHKLVVKHHALAQDLGIKTGIQRSVLASKSNVRKACFSNEPFLLETDYVDEPALGWKVIPPDSVPRRATMIRSEVENWETVFNLTFRQLPMELFGEDMFQAFQ